MVDEENRKGPIQPEVVTELPARSRRSQSRARLILRLILLPAVGWWLFNVGMERILPESRVVGFLALWLALLIALIAGASALREVWPSGPALAFLVWVLIGVGVGGWHILSPTAPATVPDVTMHLVNPQAPAVWLENLSDVVAENIKYQFALCNLDDPSSIGVNGDISFVPIPVRTFDFLRPHARSATMALFEHPGAAAAVRPGHRLFGFVTVTCPRCVRDRTFFVFIEVGHGGWSSELPEGQFLNATAFAEALPSIAKSPDLEKELLALVPVERRVPVAIRVD